MHILDGKRVSGELSVSLKERVRVLQKKGVNPKLVFFLIGDNLASQKYVEMKQKMCEEIGVLSKIVRYTVAPTRVELVEKISEFNADERVHGMMIQLRMPEGDLNNHEQEILDEIAPEKDVDGLHSLNQENPMREGGFMAATVKGTFYLFESESIDVQGKNVVCIGRTNLFGKPFAKACDAKGASCVALLGRDWKEHMDKLKEADIIVGAVGEGKILVEPDMVKESVVLIDVGLGPDINWKAMIEAGKSGYTTKRWGGTGPVTVYSIVENCVLAAERRLVAIF